MKADRSWQLGMPGTLSYRLYDELRKWLNRHLVNYLSRMAVQREHSLVLEAGSGPAFTSSLFAQDRRVRLSVAVDLDLEALYQARRRDPLLPAVAADLYRLPFVAESFDLVWNSSTLEHLESPGVALAEMQRVTRPGGHVFVGVPYLYGPLGFQRWIADTSVGVWIGTVFTRTQLKGMLHEAGLQPRDSIFYFFRFFVGVLAQK